MDLANLLPNLRANGEHSDLTIICGSEAFKVHRCIVCARSTWLATACKEGRWKEGESGVIGLKASDSAAESDGDYSCDHPEAVRLWLDYIYLGDYIPGSTPSRAELSTSGATTVSIEEEPAEYLDSQAIRKKKKKAFRSVPYEEDDYGLVRHGSFDEGIPALGSSQSLFEQPSEVLAMHARVYAMAAKYDMPSLKTKAVVKMQQSLKGPFDKADFANAIVIAFRSTPDGDLGLRNIFVSTLLRDSASLAGDEFIKHACLKIEGLGWELFRQQSRQALQSRVSAYADWE